MTSNTWDLDAAMAEPQPRRDVLRRIGLLGAALLAVSTMPAIAAGPARKRVIVTLIDIDRESEIEELFAALRRYDYRLVRVEEDRPTVILDVSDRTLRMLRRLDVVASVSLYEPPPPPEARLQLFRVSIRRNVDFNDAVETVRDQLQEARHKVVQVDRATRSMLIRMRETDIPLIAALRVVRSVVAEDGSSPIPEDERPEDDGISPIPEGENPTHAVRRSKKQRIIVQFDANRNRNAEIRRILRALEGLPHRVVTRFEVTPAIVIEMDDRGMQRLRRLPGIRLQADGLAAPL